MVSNQIDLPRDGILGRDFLKQAHAQLCYVSNTLTFSYTGVTIVKSLGDCSPWSELENLGDREGSVKLTPRSETIVKLPVREGTTSSEGLVEKRELLPGEYLARSLVRVEKGYVLANVLNTTEEGIEMQKPVVEFSEIDNPDQAQGSPTRLPRDRYEEVLRKLRLEHLSGEERKSLSRCIFFLHGDRLSCTDTVKHAIPLETGTVPINTRLYRLPDSQKEEIEKQVTSLLKEGIIVQSNSPWNSPILVVPKRVGVDGESKWRLVVDFRKLNEKTIGDAHPLPDITEILDQLGQSKYFSCLDMVMGYHQIELEKGEGPKTAFSTKQGHWEYKRLPFGLKTAPPTFQKLMNSVLSGLTGIRCFVYLDDIVIYAKSLVENETKLREVLGRLREHRLKLQPEKCEFYGRK